MRRSLHGGGGGQGCAGCTGPLYSRPGQEKLSGGTGVAGGNLRVLDECSCPTRDSQGGASPLRAWGARRSWPPPPSGCHTRTPGRSRTARRDHRLLRLPEDLRLTSRARVRDEIGAPGSGDLPTFPCVLARPVRLGYALSTCPRVAHPPRVAALREFRRPSLSPCRAVGLKGRPSSFTVAAQVPLSSRASSYADLTVRGGLHDRQPFRLPAPVQGRSGCR